MSSGGVANLAVPVVGFVLASRRPGNRVGWLFLVAALTLGLGGFSAAYGLHALVAAPGSWPAGRAFAWFSSWIYVIPLAMLAFVFLLFPSGRLRSRRWRPVAWFVGGAFALIEVDLVVNATRFWPDPFSPVSQAGDPLGLASVLTALAALVVGVVAVVVRFARSAGEERLQLKWFAAAALLVVITFIASVLINSVVVNVLNNLAFLCLWAAIGVAVLKYRLYEIDIVISKAVLYGALAVFITAVYAGLVVGVGTLAGGRDSPLLAALAAAVVAVAFQPARQWAGRLANRVVYGRRATPYQVLSDFARRIGSAYSHQDVLPQMAQTVAAGTGAGQVVVWLRVDDQLHPVASSGGSPPAVPPPADGLSVEGQAMPSMPDADMSVPVVHGDDLVAAQDEARRRLERNLHDGAQQDLVALSIKARLGTTVEALPQAKEIFGELQADAAGALENLRDLARGIYPPLLADLGLAAALNAQAAKSTVPVAVEAGGIGRFGQDTEAAVYFCCLEALQNTAKYAHATHARICLQAQNGTLRFTVSDDGTGYDARHTPLGSGQRNMADRLAALGGRLEVLSTPGQGTTITAQLPTVPAGLPIAARGG